MTVDVAAIILILATVAGALTVLVGIQARTATDDDSAPYCVQCGAPATHERLAVYFNDDDSAVVELVCARHAT